MEPRPNREIPRNLEAPELKAESIQLLTELCFRHDDKPEPSDLIFVFGTTATEDMSKKLGSLLLDEAAKRVLLTGGIPNFSDSRQYARPESELLLEALNREKYPNVEFLTENRSTNTLENVRFGLEAFDFSQAKSLIFLSFAHHAGRAHGTLRKYLKEAKLYQQTINRYYPEGDIRIGRDNWFQSAFGRTRVWGEFSRIKNYGQKRDIEFDAGLVERIEKSL